MIKISFVLLVGLATTALLRRRSAAVRHWVLAAVIACAAITPVLERMVPAWQLPAAVAQFGRPAPLSLYIPIHEGQSLATADMVGTRSAPIDRAHIDRWLRPIWLVGIGISLAMLLVGFTRLAWVASRSERVVRGRWTELALALSRGFGLRRPVRLLQSDHPTLLVTWGLLQPKVILPRAARDWTGERARIVLGHELAHIRRHDWLVQMMAELLRAVYWFNPLVWIACRQLRRESEHACDDAVLGLGVEAPDYATHLLDLARAFSPHQQRFLPAPAMARPSSLERRVRAMLNARLNRTPLTRPASFAIVIALLAITLPLAGLVASAQNATATFSGSLMDAIGRMLPDQPLTLSDAQSHQKHEARSDPNGRFSFAGVPAGDYLLEVEKPGFARAQGRVTLGAGQHLRQDVALQIGEIQETISIRGGDRPTPPPSPPPPPPPVAVSQPEYDRCADSPVGGCIMQPIKVRDRKPVYPEAQRAAGTGGLVVIVGRIGTDGFPADLHAVAPASAAFANAAIEAIRYWQFRPTRLDGVPVETPFRVTATFFVE